MTIYEVFEFRNGKSVKHVEGPLMFIRVEDGENRHDVLEAVGLPGNKYGYGLREITDFEAERKAIEAKASQWNGLLDQFLTLSEIG